MARKYTSESTPNSFAKLANNLLARKWISSQYMVHWCFPHSCLFSLLGHLHRFLEYRLGTRKKRDLVHNSSDCANPWKRNGYKCVWDCSFPGTKWRSFFVNPFKVGTCSFRCAVASTLACVLFLTQQNPSCLVVGLYIIRSISYFGWPCKLLPGHKRRWPWAR